MDNQELNNLKQAEEASLVTSNSLDGTSAISDPDDPLSPTTKVTRTPRISQNSTIEINPFVLVGLLFAVVVIWLAIASLKDLFRTNPYGEQIKINNFSRYFKDMPEDDRDAVTNALYIITKSNNPDNTDLSKISATIRDGSTNTDYDSTDDVYTSTFLVDIVSLQQTYNIWVYWSTNPNNSTIATAGYTVMTYCPTEKQLIYPAFECVDSSNSQGVSTDPIMRYVPITRAYYLDNYAKYIQYTITAKIDEGADKLTITITNQYGEAERNFRDALDYMRQELNLDPDNYTIKYLDESADYEAIPAKAN